MGLFNDKFQHGNKFTVDTTDFPGVNLSEIIAENGHKTLKVQKVFTVVPTKGSGKGKEKPVLVADNHIIWLPEHCLSDVTKLLESKEYIDAINAGKCGFTTSEYEDEKHGQGTCYSGTFVDIDG